MFFCYHFWSLSDLFVFVAKFFSQVCQNHPSACRENKIGEINLENLFSLNNFGLWAEKTWTFSKTVRHDSQNLSLHVQMNIFKKISGSKNNCMKVFGHRTERSVFRRKCFLRVVKGAFQVFSSTLWEKDDKVNFTFCGLFRTVCVFFWSERKVSQGFQNHKLSVQMKKIGRVFLTHMLSENIFSFWAEKLAVLAKNYRHGCQNCNLRTFRKFWGKTVFFKLNMIANFFGLRDEENWDFGQKNFLQSYYNRNSRFQRNVLRKNDFSFERGFIFLLSFLEFEWFLCLFCKIL